MQYTERLSKNGNKKIKQKAIAIVLIKNDGGLEYCGRSGNGQKYDMAQSQGRLSGVYGELTIE